MAITTRESVSSVDIGCDGEVIAAGIGDCIGFWHMTSGEMVRHESQ